MLLSQAGLMGVFVATDALLFYFFWELALIPVYFLCSQWGGEKRIPVTFKFFVYTFIGSLLMLIGIIWIYAHTPDHSFSLESFYAMRSRDPGPGSAVVVLDPLHRLCHQNAHLAAAHLAAGYL